jgi:hypothetical protein
LSTTEPAPGALPNLIVIMLDSFRQDRVGAYHSGQAPFPGIAPCQVSAAPGR